MKEEESACVNKRMVLEMLQKSVKLKKLLEERKTR